MHPSRHYDQEHIRPLCLTKPHRSKKILLNLQQGINPEQINKSRTVKKLIRYLLNRVPRRHIQRVAHLAVPVMGLAYAGRGRQCPVCGCRVRKFMPYGYVESREDALCPRCLSLERHRLMWLFLQRETDLFKTTPRLLHVAPERCFIKKFEKLLGENYVTADLESPLAKVKMDIHDIPFPDGSFDVVFCNHLLEHVEDDRRAMREICRVMRPGGWGIVLCPVNPARATTYEDPSITTPEGRREAFGQPDHLREYGRDYADRLAEAGFEVDSRDYIERFSPEEAARYGLRPETIYMVRKKGE